MSPGTKDEKIKENKDNKDKKPGKYTIWALAALAVAGVAGVAFLYFFIIRGMQRNTHDLEGTIYDLQNRNLDLQDRLDAEQQKNASFEEQIGQIASTVGKLDKLSKTDKELLQKYSKVYFLNENYVPGSMVEIPADYVYRKERIERIHTKVLPYLEDMINDAKNDGMDLKIISAYRSFSEQASLKSSYSVVYGSGANKFSADQGYSEHQLGTTVDLTTSELGAGYTKFKSAEAYDWMLKNAYKYGFVISYPEGNSYYQFEPWHWRFVGRGLAKRLYEEKQYFYDLSQRNIDSYLIDIFD